jgi:hypothetical protein
VNWDKVGGHRFEVEDFGKCFLEKEHRILGRDFKPCRKLFAQVPGVDFVKLVVSEHRL